MQAQEGYRVAIDPIFLRGRRAGGSGHSCSIVSAAGVGAAALCLAWREQPARCAASRCSAILVRLAARNVDINGFAVGSRSWSATCCGHRRGWRESFHTSWPIAVPARRSRDAAAPARARHRAWEARRIWPMGALLPDMRAEGHITSSSRRPAEALLASCARGPARSWCFPCGRAAAVPRAACSCAHARKSARRRGWPPAWCCTSPTGVHAAAEAILRDGVGLMLDVPIDRLRGTPVVAVVRLTGVIGADGALRAGYRSPAWRRRWNAPFRSAA